jgi:hypothetical protein
MRIPAEVPRLRCFDKTVWRSCNMEEPGLNIVTRRWVKTEITQENRVYYGQGQYLPSIRDFIMVTPTEKMLRTKWVFWDSLRGYGEICRQKDRKALNGDESDDDEIKILTEIRKVYDWNGKELLWSTRSMIIDQDDPPTSDSEDSAFNEPTSRVLGELARKVRFSDDTERRLDASDVIHSASTRLLQLGVTDITLSAPVVDQQLDASNLAHSASRENLSIDEINDILDKEAEDEAEIYARTAWEILEELEQTQDDQLNTPDGEFSIPTFIQDDSELDVIPATGK